MKTRISQVRLMTLLGAISFSAIAATFAEDSAPAAAQTTTTTATAVVVDGVPSPTVTLPQTTPVVTTAATPKLPYGVEDVLKLSRAQVSEDVTLSYIQGSGTIYNLGPNDIVYLKEQGVSAKVINTMLEQRKKALDSATQTAAAAQQPATTDPNAAVTAPLTPTYSEAAPTYYESAPDYVPASTVYVIGSPAVRYAYYNSAPYYNYNYGSPYRYYGASYGAPYCAPAYCAPSVVVRFGGGGHSYGHSFHHR